MKLFAVLLVVLVCLEVTSASRLGRVLGSAFAVHKKTKKAAANKNGEATVKSKKIKQIPVQKLKEDIDVSNQKVKIDVVDVSAKEDPTRAVNFLKRQASLLGRQNMVLSIGRMVLSRFVFKINYKDPKTLVYARLAFVGYLLLYQALLWFLSQQVNKRDDSTILHKSPNSGMQALLSKVGSLSGQSAMTNTLLNLAQLASPAEDKITVKAHDTKQIKELTSTLYFELFTTSVMHFVFGFQVPVLMAPLMGVCKLLQHPLVLLHVFRMRPVGQLERPFKTGLETFMSALTPAKPVADTVASTSAASSTSAGAPDANPSDKRIVGATMMSRPDEKVKNEDGEVSDEVESEVEEEGMGEEVVEAGAHDDSTDIAEGNEIVDASEEDETDEQEATEADQDAVIRGESHVEEGEEIEVEAGDVENKGEEEDSEVEEGTQAPAETEKDPESDEAGVIEEEVDQRQEEADGDNTTAGDDEEEEEDGEGDGNNDDTEDASEEDAQDDDDVEDDEEDDEALEEEEGGDDVDGEGEEGGDDDEGDEAVEEEEEQEEKEWWEKEEENSGDDDELLDAIDHLGE